MALYPHNDRIILQADYVVIYQWKQNLVSTYLSRFGNNWVTYDGICFHPPADTGQNNAPCSWLLQPAISCTTHGITDWGKCLMNKAGRQAGNGSVFPNSVLIGKLPYDLQILTWGPLQANHLQFQKHYIILSLLQFYVILNGQHENIYLPFIVYPWWFCLI